MNRNNEEKYDLSKIHSFNKATLVDLDTYLKSHKKDKTFTDILLDYEIQLNKTRVEVYSSSGISKELYSSFFSKKTLPKRNTLLALTIGLKLNLIQCRELFSSCGYEFPKNKTELIVAYYISHDLYDYKQDEENIMRVNELLNAYDLEVLGSHSR